MKKKYKPHPMSIYIHQDVLQSIIENYLTGTHKKLAAEALASIAAKEDWMAKAVINSLHGVEPKVQYKEGDKVLVDTRVLNTWSWDEAMMTAKGMIKNGKIEGVVAHVDKWHKLQYHVEFDYLEHDGATNTRVMPVAGINVQAVEEFPENLDGDEAKD